MTTATPADDGDDREEHPQPPPVVGAESAPESLPAHTRRWLGHVTPPDLWRHGRPSLKTSWVWAKHGTHLPDDELARLGSRIGAGITIPVRAVLLYADWLLERPSRFVAAALLLTCLGLAVF